MVSVFRARLKQGHHTSSYPDGEVRLPERYRGLPKIDQSKCPSGCQACIDACPTQALMSSPPRSGGDPTPNALAGLQSGRDPTPNSDARLTLDLGRCLFCTECTDACPEGAITLTPEFRMATRRREDLIITDDQLRLAEALDSKMKRLFGRSLKLRQVSAAGCNGCEVEANATGNIVFDAFRFGIQFVASPRHADGLLITGPVSRNMELALRKTYDAVPAPKLVIAVGACAISGGPFRDHPEVLNGVDGMNEASRRDHVEGSGNAAAYAGLDGVLPVDLYIPGSPPHPLTILDGLLRLLGRIESGKR